MGNHAIAKAVGPAAEAAVRMRAPGQSALEILDMLCAPWRGCDAEWEAEDPKRPGFCHPDFNYYTDPHPQAALGMLMVEAFAPNGIKDLPKYQHMVPQLRPAGAPDDDDLEFEAYEAWRKDVGEPFDRRYGFC
jgi:hypothetical protein